MADSNAGFQSPADYDKYVQSVLADTDVLAPSKAATKPAAKAPGKSQAGSYDTYIGDTLKDVDALLAPPKTTGPLDKVQPEGGPLDSIWGTAEGAWNTVKGMFTGAAGEALGLADIPVHAFGKATGLYNAPEPESVESGVSDLLTATPGTRRGERTSEAVQEGAGDILGAGGRALKALTGYAGKIPAGADTSFGAGFQSRFGIPVPGVTPQNPEGVVQQTPEEGRFEESLGNAPATVMFGGKSEGRSALLEEPAEPPPPVSENIHEGPAYSPPRVVPRGGKIGSTETTGANDAAGIKGLSQSILQVRKSKAPGPEELQDLSRSVNALLQKNPSLNAIAAAENGLSKLRERVPAAGETVEKALSNLRQYRQSKASLGLQQASEGDVAVPGMPSESAPGTGGRRQPGIASQVRAAYDKLTPEERETTALKDSQTGLYSRGMYDRMEAGNRPQVFFDLRSLKQANDVHGHSYGDAIIKAFGDAAKQAGVSGQMFRYGGDEFSMLVDGPEGLAQARKLQQALQGATVEAILPDGTRITTKGIDADYGYGKNKDAADQAAYAAKRANKSAPADAQAGGERPRLGGAAAEGDQVQGQSAQDLTRQFQGTNSSTHTPYPEGQPPADFVLGKIRLRQGDRDVVVPVKTEFEEAGDQELYKIGEQVLASFGDDAEPRPNTSSPSGRELIDRMRQYVRQNGPAWRQNDDRANLAYARAFARDVRDLHQRGYNVLRDHLEDKFPDNPKGELRANPHKYAFTTKVPRWMPRDLVTKCF